MGSRRISELLDRDWFGTNRVMCNVLEDIRSLDKTKNYGPLLGLVEELQVMGNRMESALADQKDLIKLQQRTSELRREYKNLKKEVEELLKKKEELEPKEVKE